ncbi:MAG: pirin family protein [Candidatus Bathyarchaeota archaeon]|nr:pirin family protein [Candidatus Bathyarchaeota archaeon]
MSPLPFIHRILIKGFEAITYMLEGGFHHIGNLGNDTVVLAGGLQKFTAGKGIVHAELPLNKRYKRKATVVDTTAKQA